LGSPENVRAMMIELAAGAALDREDLLRDLIDIQYSRNDAAFTRGTFRVRGDVVEIRPAYEEEAIRIEFFGDVVESISIADPLTGKRLRSLEKLTLFPAKLFVTPEEVVRKAAREIRDELSTRVVELREQGRLV